tara:strand:- start:6696 stop:8303 length:1608 start_codon:yes stop_codon:yes gene_type:complete
VTKFKKIFQDIIFVSRLTNVNKKKIRIFLSVFLANCTVLFDILVILVFANIIENSQTDERIYVEFIKDNIYLLPLIVVLRFLFIFIERINIQSLQLQVEENLRTHLMQEVFNKNNYSVADAYFYINELSRNVSYFYGSIASSINYFLQIVVYSAYLLLTSLNIVAYFFFGAMILFFPTRYFLIKGREYIHDAYENEHKTLENIQRVLENIYLIKILSTTNREVENFKITLRKYYSSVLNNFKFGAINNITPNFITIFILAVLLAFFDFVRFLTLEFIGVMLRLFQTLGNFNNTLNLVFNSHVHLEKLNSLEQNKVNDVTNVLIFDKNLENKAIKLDNISFKYFGNDSYIFENLSLEIDKDTHTVITGDNGSGKSTLLGLVSGILIPEKGRVTLYSKKLAYVGATPLIINGTLRENIMYGNDKSISDDEIIDFANSFKLFEKNEDLDLNKRISNKTLSSGQMQKVSFIRAIVSRPDILILDEATSNLDVDSREIVKTQLSKLNLTIINSTHNSDEVAFDSKLQIEVSHGSRVVRNI